MATLHLGRPYSFPYSGGRAAVLRAGQHSSWRGMRSLKAENVCNCKLPETPARTGRVLQPSLAPQICRHSVFPRIAPLCLAKSFRLLFQSRELWLLVPSPETRGPRPATRGATFAHRQVLHRQGLVCRIFWAVHHALGAARLSQQPFAASGRGRSRNSSRHTFDGSGRCQVPVPCHSACASLLILPL